MNNLKEFFDRNGYVIIKNLFAKDDCITWRKKINENFKLTKADLKKHDLYKKTLVDPDGVTKNSSFWSIIFNKKLINIIENILGQKVKYTQHSDIHINFCHKF